MRKEMVEVDQDCIDNGCIDSLTCCPVALAIGKHYRNVEVSTTQIGIGPVEDTIFFENTEKVEQWIRDFDTEKDVKPTSITLDFENGIAYISDEAVE